MESRATIAVAELLQVHELVKKLDAHLSQSQLELCRTLASEIIFSVEKAICAAKVCCAGEVESVLSNGRGQQAEAGQKASKKRKLLQNWTNQVRVSSEAGSEMPSDGHSWRKYGQKDILGAKYPRAYYRCTHRKTRGCSAMKQVQKSDENPTVLDITYLGNHSCSSSPQCSASKTLIHGQRHRPLDQQSTLTTHIDFQNSNFKWNAESSGLENQNPFFSFSFPSTPPPDVMMPENEFFCSSAIMSPNTSGSNCFPLPPCDLELDEILSASISAAESPAVDADFMAEYGSMSTDFYFDTSVFFV